MVKPLWQAARERKRKPTDLEIQLWLKAADDRTTPRSRAEIIQYLKAKNPHRWRRVQGDVRWMKRMMAKLGLNPEEWKELL
jgi:hypothetical protein